MGKKSKKSGGNTKKVKETTSVSVESSKPTTPEIHPYSLPDSTATPDESVEEAGSNGALHEDSTSPKSLVDGDERVVSVNGTGQEGGNAEGSDQEVVNPQTLNHEDRPSSPLSEATEADIVPKEVSDIVAPEVVPETIETEPELEETGNEHNEVEADLAEIPLVPEDPAVPPLLSSTIQTDEPSPVEIRPDSDIEIGVGSMRLYVEPSTIKVAPTDPKLQSPSADLEAQELNAVAEDSSPVTVSEQPPISTPPLPKSPGFRELLPSKSNPRTPSPNLSREGSEAGPSRQLSTSSHRSSPRRTPTLSRSEFTSPIKSPRHVPFYAPNPTIPASAPIIVTGDNDEVADDSIPFESIPLQTTPPGLSVSLPLSPGLHPGNGHGNDSVTPSSRLSITIPPSRPLSVQLSRGDTPATPEKKEAPRLHAPPAHPHPFPIPSTSPRPSHEKRPSQSQAGPSGGLGVKGVSTFEKVISHTRPSWLPPKDRTEDETHYHQWEEMMSQAREAEKEKRKVEEAKRAERDKRLAINTPKWEEMLDEKTFNVDKIRKDPALRQIWFEGCPTYLRGKAWSLAIGNPLALSKDLYRTCVARSKKAIASGRFPADILERIEADLDQTLVNLHLFQHGSPLRADLHELICAWVVYRSDTALGYASHINLLAALFLLSSPPATAFLSLINLLSRPVLRAFYTETQDEIDAFYRVFENLQADTFPKIFANCKNLGLKVPESWFRSVLVEQVPFEAACRLWDQIVLDGDGYIFRSALAIFGFLEPRLYFPDRDEIASILEGRNHATQAIVDREKERAKLRGETYLDELDGKLSVFGLNEQALFDWLANDGWKEARFERLVTREMPD